MNKRIVEAAALVLLEEVLSLVNCIEITGKVPADRLPGLKERLNSYKTILENNTKGSEK